MTRRILILLLLAISASVHAAHIAGGELQYKYIGPGSAGTDQYEVTMRLFRECSSTGPQLANEIVNVGAYSSSTMTLSSSVILSLTGGISEIVLQEGSIPCLVGSPNVCYQVAIYVGIIELPRTPEGYILAWARCCRANGLANASGQIGATYTTRIPGTTILPVGSNNSPQFVMKDTALVCGDNDFVLDFGALDSDGDSLSYSFCSAYLGGTTANQSAPPPANLSLQPIPYSGGFSGFAPLGPDVFIDSKTGIISGLAPSSPGRYVVNVCVTEWRNGVAISQHRKDFILKVGDCNIIAAKLKDQYINCDSLTSVFQNENNSSQIQSYFWDFGVTGSLSDTSVAPQPSFTYPDTGVYQIKLIINRNQECSDTAISLVRVFPGFDPKFSVAGSCYMNPFSFIDQSTVAYGVINKWRWDFGEATDFGDTSINKNASYQYPNIGNRTVQLYVESSKGCFRTIQQNLSVTDKPFLKLPFKDTLICRSDSLIIPTEGSGIFQWTPNISIINSNTSSPTVFPNDSMYYIVKLSENSCSTSDTVRINVIDSVTVRIGNDTAICQTDLIGLKVQSQALAYSWSPAEGLDDITKKEPGASPSSTTTYFLVASIGKCEARDSVTIRVSPYPVSKIGNDTAICFGDRIQLTGIAMSNGFSWSPVNSMINSNSLTPIAGPSGTTKYILTATGYQECPKSVYDTITITVIPPVKAFAGNDTTVTGDEPLLLHATGGIDYSWSPAMHMNNASISSPIVLLSNNIDEMRYKVTVTTEDGCKGEDEIKIVVFKTGPQIFVPDAFTPNNDTKNDLLYPVVVGMKQLSFFRVYNRLGQLLFSTSEIGKGWDGKFGGKEQSTGTYVYMAQAINYKGEVVSKKGTILLIR